MIQLQTKKMILDLFSIGSIQFGSFILKSGIASPIYIDLRRVISFPKLVKEIRDALWQLASVLEFSLICGVPYTALPLATAISLEYNVPMLMRRKEIKEYGTRSSIEGIFNKEQFCLIIEDVITTGQSILETVVPLQNLGIAVKDICVVLNREQSGVKALQKNGLFVHSLISIYEILEVLYEEKKIEENIFQNVTYFLKSL
ncbi:orotate phosphoribosyltransferase [Candidatus Rhabdochlamydia porcellionis]|jgi:orotate phosphoribosyltransferase|uniref:Orotate phosphoribosyltransferase n=1 Tax=Candidatus Rhabdochlamydia porcellionis TaxID=225148 RepID=A0ABX8Z1R6_9BACT|nr:orotate phosphoribosyltransferase [Candidatus Rhabdochlamydia porcellionis]QZA59300.1 Orotate phosphoribosyltransferase [Candidatus Rhabdochlamydia porcellionis]